MDEEMKEMEKNKETITSLQEEVQKCGNCIREHEENESNMNKEIKTLRKNLKEKERANANNTLLKSLDKKFKEFEEAIRKEVHDNNRSIEQRINQAVEQKYTYANAVGTNEQRDDDWDNRDQGVVGRPKVSNQENNLRRIIFEARNEESKRRENRKFALLI